MLMAKRIGPSLVLWCTKSGKEENPQRRLRSNQRGRTETRSSSEKHMARKRECSAVSSTAYRPNKIQLRINLRFNNDVAIVNLDKNSLVVAGRRSPWKENGRREIRGNEQRYYF